MSDIYTQRIATGVLTGSSDVFTVPTGSLVVVRCFDVLNTHATVAGQWGFGQSAATNILPVRSPTLQPSESWKWEGRYVFYAGETVRVSRVGSTITCHYQLTAYEFTA